MRDGPMGLQTSLFLLLLEQFEQPRDLLVQSTALPQLVILMQPQLVHSSLDCQLIIMRNRLPHLLLLLLTLPTLALPLGRRTCRRVGLGLGDVFGLGGWLGWSGCGGSGGGFGHRYCIIIMNSILIGVCRALDV